VVSKLLKNEIICEKLILKYHAFRPWVKLVCFICYSIFYYLSSVKKKKKSKFPHSICFNAYISIKSNVFVFSWCMLHFLFPPPTQNNERNTIQLLEHLAHQVYQIRLSKSLKVKFAIYLSIFSLFHPL
jgi:hypothetical protein